MTETEEGKNITAKGDHNASLGGGPRLAPPQAAAKQRWEALLYTSKKPIPWICLLMLFYSEARHSDLEPVGLV